MTELSDLIVEVDTSLVSAPSLLEIVPTIERAVGTIDEYEKSAEALVEGVTAVGVKKQAAYEELSANAQLIEKQKAVAAMGTQITVGELFEEAGGSEMLHMLATQRKEDIGDVIKFQERLQVNNEHETFNPIEWISNAIDEFNNEAYLEGAQRRLVNTTNALASLSAGSEQNVTILKSTEKLITEGTMTAGLRNIALEYDLKATDASILALRDNAEAMSTLASARGAQFQQMVAAHNLGASEEDRRQRKVEHNFRVSSLIERLAQSKTDREKAAVDLEQAVFNLDFAKETRPENIAQKKLATESAQLRMDQANTALDQQVQVVRRGLALLGLPDRTSEEIKGGFSQGGDVEKVYQDLYVLGGTGEDVLGIDPSDVLGNILKHNPAMLTQSEHPVVKQMLAVKQAIEEKSATTGLKYTKQQLSDLVNESMKKTFDDYAANIEEGDMSNPYAAAPLPALVASSEELLNDPLYVRALKDLGRQETRPSVVVQDAIAAIKSRAVTMDEAVTGINTLFNAAALHSAAKHNFTKFGIANTSGYFTRLDVPKIYGPRLELIDLTDPTAVKRMFVLSLNAGARSAFERDEFLLSP